MKMNNKGIVGTVVLGIVALGAVLGAFITYVGHFPR